MGQFFRWREGQGLIPISEVPIEDPIAPAIIGDTMDRELWHPAYKDGRKTDSRSKFRDWTKAAGCYELGNDTIPQETYQPSEREMARTEGHIWRAIEEVESRSRK
jgi:hypothetical protein